MGVSLRADALVASTFQEGVGGASQQQQQQPDDILYSLEFCALSLRWSSTEYYQVPLALRFLSDR